jgi:hypothetical protein
MCKESMYGLYGVGTRVARVHRSHALMVVSIRKAAMSDGDSRTHKVVKEATNAEGHSHVDIRTQIKCQRMHPVR